MRENRLTCGVDGQTTAFPPGNDHMRFDRMMIVGGGVIDLINHYLGFRPSLGQVPSPTIGGDIARCSWCKCAVESLRHCGNDGELLIGNTPRSRGEAPLLNRVFHNARNGL